MPHEAWPASPAHAHYAPLFARLCSGALPSAGALDVLLDERHVNGAGLRIRFVESQGIADASNVEGFEVRTWRSGEVALRPGNWHDLFNALSWVLYPHTKRELNRLHHEHEAGPGNTANGSARGTARGVLTLFDEDGLIVACAEPMLAGLLADFRWKELFWLRREAVARSMRFQVFGHALADKLRAPFRGLTAKALVFAVDASELLRSPAEQAVAMDVRVAAWLREPAALASTRALQPLPVLGIPGWYADNARADYYDDTWQFRPGRRSGGVHSPA